MLILILPGKLEFSSPTLWQETWFKGLLLFGVIWSCWISSYIEICLRSFICLFYKWRIVLPLNIVAGTPVGKLWVSMVKNWLHLGCVAQLAEHWIPNPKVVGSNPAAFSDIRDSIVASIPACHAGDRGSIPRRGARTFCPFGLVVWFLLWVQEVPGSNPGTDPDLIAFVPERSKGLDSSSSVFVLVGSNPIECIFF